ncbi:hypothetical protein K3495_g11791 [Podosphaera aphanis]|nr:hypothetical protein K3495_g11791 [Podosphaera aphanis]
MHSPPFLINCLLNDSTYTKAVVDTGCLCYSVIDETLVRNNKFKLFPTRPRTLHLADGKSGTTITKIARLKLDIDGQDNDTVYLAKRRCLRFGSRQHGTLVHASDWYENGAPLSIKSRVAHVSLAAASLTTGNVFAALANKAESINGATIGAITMYDITQALKPKVTEPDEVIISKLPVEIRQHSRLFIDDKLGINHALPPHRKGVDTHINLKRQTRKTSRDPLGATVWHVMRRTTSLTKNFVRIIG